MAQQNVTENEVEDKELDVAVAVDVEDEELEVPDAVLEVILDVEVVAVLVTAELDDTLT
ncbi:hypothetical protein HK096_009563, partial [Nowakowskiella sp. JEL0078]